MVERFVYLIGISNVYHISDDGLIEIDLTSRVFLRKEVLKTFDNSS